MPLCSAEMCSSRLKPRRLSISSWLSTRSAPRVWSWRSSSPSSIIAAHQKEKIKINHKRIRRYIDKKHLYPGEDYDLDIVFETVENRKKRHLMGKRHVDGLTIERPPEL